MRKVQICYPVETKILSDGTCKKNWVVKERIGKKSASGKVWEACCEENCNYVLKFLPYKNEYNTKESIIKEIDIQERCAAIGLCPKIADAWLCKEGGTIVMEVFDKTVEKLLLKYKSQTVREKILANVLALLVKLHLNGFYHGDVHLNNIMVKSSFVGEKDPDEEKDYENRKYTYYFIDMGLAGKVKSIDDEKIQEDYSTLHSEILYLIYKDKSFKSLVESMENYMKNMA